jgi:thioredoxin 1
VDIDENEALVRKFNIVSVPTLKIFKDGKEINSSVGLISEKRLMELISE